MSKIGKTFFPLIAVGLFSLSGLASCQDPSADPPPPISPLPTAPWARVPTAGSSETAFKCAAADSQGNVYAAGFQSGSGEYSYGPGVSAAAVGTKSAVLVKYDPDGKALWARAVSGYYSVYEAVSIDSADNVYVAGSQIAKNAYDYGDSVIVSGSGGSHNVVVAKYDGSGKALWARSLSGGDGQSAFSGICVKGSALFAVGFQAGTIDYTYGPGASAAGAVIGSRNAVLVKYDLDGTAQWARTVQAAAKDSSYNAVAADSAGNIYAAGSQSGNGEFDYGNGVKATGSCAGGANPVNALLVKYDASGAPITAKVVNSTESTNISEYWALRADGAGNIYAAGLQSGNGTFTYAPLTLTPQASCGLLVKYDSSGNALTARVGGNLFFALDFDSADNVYVIGKQSGKGVYTYSPGVSAQGTSAQYNAVALKYDASGTAVWAASVIGGTAETIFNGAAVDGAGNLYAAGLQYGTGPMSYGSGVSVSGLVDGNNSVLVKYRPVNP